MKNRTSYFSLLGIGLMVVTLFLTNCKESTPPPTLSEKESRRLPRPLLQPTKLDTIDGVFHYSTGPSLFDESDPYINPPGSNLLANIFTNAYDSEGREMVNTLPSTPTVPYNLHHGTPTVSKIDPTSPRDDLQAIFDFFLNPTETNPSQERKLQKLQFGIDILEGVSINEGDNCIYGGPARNYSGFPLLHYNGPEKIKKVSKLDQPDIQNGDTIHYNVDVRQLWFDSHIESNTSMLDLSEVQDVPWMVTYYIDVLHRGEDDFSPFSMFFDFKRQPDSTYKKVPHVAMDQSYYPMEEGTRSIIKVKMPPGKYYSLTYTWGWRMHPPRVQVMENRFKRFPDPANNQQMTRLDSFEINVFGGNPTLNPATREQAISMISNLAPAKRMWNIFRNAYQQILANQDPTNQLEEGFAAFKAWQDRTHLPDASLLDEDSDATLLYVNNTIYSSFTDGGTTDFPNWRTRGDKLKVTIKNGDYFWHAYQNVDFGGARGWENAYKSSVRVGGSGCWFTFGRVYFWPNLGPKFIRLSPAEKGSLVPSVQKAQITFNYEPSRRLRYYQFDPFHHDVAVFSVH